MAVGFAIGGIFNTAAEIASTNYNANVGSEATMLDISPFFRERFVTAEHTNMEMVSVSGRKIFDGLPFQVDGRGGLYGKALAHQRNRPASAFPDFLGIKVGRTFDELHLLHATQFTDQEKAVVAKVRINYSDRTHFEFPLAYGVQVRDWQRLQSEEKEIYTDPDTKVIWRGPGVKHFKSTTRMSKTRLINPFPAKLVLTIDFVSAGNVASYDIAAATVANRDPNRPVTPPVPLDRPERNFDSSLTVRVVDEVDQPIEGVLVSPNISVGGSLAATVATPLYTTTNGTGAVKYPKNESAAIYFVVQKADWRRIENDAWIWFNRSGITTNGLTVTIRMSREDSTLVAATTKSASPKIGSENLITTTSNGFASVVSAPAIQNGRLGIRFSGNQPLLLVDFPVGSNVRVEYKCDLNATVWQSLTVITNLPSSPYPYLCDESSLRPQCFYRAVLVP